MEKRADLNSLLIFAAVVESNSFSAASRRLRMPVSTVSRRVAELELELDPFLDGLEPQLGQAGDRRLRELLVGELDHLVRVCEKVFEIAIALLDRAIGLLHKHGALRETLDRARYYGAEARRALAAFDDCPEKRALIETVDFCLARGY